LLDLGFAGWTVVPVRKAQVSAVTGFEHGTIGCGFLINLVRLLEDSWCSVFVDVSVTHYGADH
jgi:hypothetical protein